MFTLPEDMEQETISGMPVGESGYTVPWAMWADLNRVLWINGNYSIHKKPHGTVCMFVERTKEGVVVYRRTIGDHKYQPRHSGDWTDSAIPVELK